MSAYRRILVAVDGSEGSRRALYFAAAAAHQHGARLLVTHVIQASPGKQGDAAGTLIIDDWRILSVQPVALK